MCIGMSVEHYVAHVHTQNSLVESFIKSSKLISRPLLMRAKIPTSIF